ncbi:MAG: hypothetical protein ABL898_15585, partial [Hyphomicrobiaceae bacterium]
VNAIATRGGAPWVVTARPVAMAGRVGAAVGGVAGIGGRGGSATSAAGAWTGGVLAMSVVDRVFGMVVWA